MSEQDNIRTVEKVFAEINAHRTGDIPEVFASDYTLEGPGAAGPMPYDASQTYLQGFITAFPDLHFNLKHKIADGDNVAVTWTATGTHTGPMRTPSGSTIPPTGKKGTVTGCTTYTFRGGKIVTSANYWDMVSLLMQLGLMPSM